jgi:hypothetical protein
MFYAMWEYAEKNSLWLPALRAYISRCIISVLRDFVKDALNTAPL